MQVTGIVCEFNPFHLGHAYLLSRLRQRGADAIVCAMSGNFDPRGEMALVNKLSRGEDGGQLRRGSGAGADHGVGYDYGGDLCPGRRAAAEDGGLHPHRLRQRVRRRGAAASGGGHATVA